MTVADLRLFLEKNCPDNIPVMVEDDCGHATNVTKVGIQFIHIKEMGVFKKNLVVLKAENEDEKDRSPIGFAQ